MGAGQGACGRGNTAGSGGGGVVSGVDPVLAVTAVGLMVMALGAAIAVRAWLRLAPAEQAFIAISLRMGVGQRGRAVLRQMAADSGVAPVALLLSPTAFETASAHMKSGDPRSERAIARLRQRVGVAGGMAEVRAEA